MKADGEGSLQGPEKLMTADEGLITAGEKLVTADGEQIAGAAEAYDSGLGADYSGKRSK